MAYFFILYQNEAIFSKSSDQMKLCAVKNVDQFFHGGLIMN